MDSNFRALETQNPTYHIMILTAVQALNEKSGSSIIAILRYLEERHSGI